MNIEGSIALVTGANKHNGIGRAIVDALLNAGAKKVYATARNIDALKEIVSKYPEQVIPLALDITDAKQINDVAAQTSDVEILINNAGIAEFAGVIASEDLQAARTEMEVNYFGTLAMIRAFAPILKANGGGAIVNLASVASWVNFPVLGSYSASKAALESATQGARAELAAQGTQITAVFPGPVDTDMAENFDMPKANPAQIAEAALKGITDDIEDVHPDSMAIEMHAGLLADHKGVEKQVGAMLPA